MKKIVLLFFCLLLFSATKAQKIDPLGIQPVTALKLSEYKKIHKLLQKCDSFALDISYTDSEEGDSYGGMCLDDFKKWMVAGEDAAHSPKANLEGFDWIAKGIFKSYEDEFYKVPFFVRERKNTPQLSRAHHLKSIS